MSVFEIYKGDGGAKFMCPIHSREEYLQSRNTEKQQQTLAAVRSGEEGRKSQLVQMNYSCLPNDDGTLKGSTRMSSTIGMDVDHIAKGEMQAVKERILGKANELGLRMLEESARGEGYHLVFKRRPELSQEENLKWASDLLGVKYDDGAKDITRVFFTTTAAELIYLEDEIFELSEMKGERKKGDGLIEKKGERKKGDGLIPTTPQTNLHPSSMNLHPTPQTNLHPSSINLLPKLTLGYCVITKGYFGLMVKGCFLLIIKNNLH